MTPSRENAISFRSFWQLRRGPLFSARPLIWICAMKMFYRVFNDVVQLEFAFVVKNDDFVDREDG